MGRQLRHPARSRQRHLWQRHPLQQLERSQLQQRLCLHAPGATLARAAQRHQFPAAVPLLGSSTTAARIDRHLCQRPTCSSKTGQVYASSYDSWGNVTSRTYSGTTATLTYDLLDHFVSWNAGSANKDLYVYDASGTRVLRRTTNGCGTTMTVYAFGLEQHTYAANGSHSSDLYYYRWQADYWAVWTPAPIPPASI